VALVFVDVEAIDGHICRWPYPWMTVAVPLTCRRCSGARHGSGHGSGHGTAWHGSRRQAFNVSKPPQAPKQAKLLDFAWRRRLISTGDFRLMQMRPAGSSCPFCVRAGLVLHQGPNRRPYFWPASADRPGSLLLALIGGIIGGKWAARSIFC
jgi:hypothetical protein